MATSVHEHVHYHLNVNEPRPLFVLGMDVDVDAHVDAVGFFTWVRLGCSVLLTRKSFAAWKEFFFADFFALFASWR